MLECKDGCCMFANICSAFINEHEKTRFMNIERSAKVTSIARLLLDTSKKNIDIFITGLKYLQEIELKILEFSPSELVIRVQPTIYKDNYNEPEIQASTEQIKSALDSIEEEEEKTLLDSAVEFVGEVVEDIVEEVKEAVEDIILPVQRYDNDEKDSPPVKIADKEVELEEPKKFDIAGFFKKKTKEKE